MKRLSLVAMLVFDVLYLFDNILDQRIQVELIFHDFWL
jgi:hypothetical protein